MLCKSTNFPSLIRYDLELNSLFPDKLDNNSNQDEDDTRNHC